MRYSEAKAFADELVKDLAKGSQTTALSPTQATDALAAAERLNAYYQKDGQRVSVLRAVSECVEACGKLNGRALSEAVDGYLGCVATVKRKDIADFIKP